jgi:LacI family transcriptional regulator
LAGYKKALEDYGIPFDESYVKYCLYGGKIEAENEAAIEEMLNLPEPPDAIFTASDRLTTGCMSVFQRKGIRVPDEIAIVGFTNISVAHLLNPPLTTVMQPAMEMGQQAVELLIRLIEHPQKDEKFETRSLKTALTIRASSVGKTVV